MSRFLGGGGVSEPVVIPYSAFMFRIFFFWLLGAALMPCSAEDLIPQSVSSDGWRALMSVPSQTGMPWGPAKLWVVELPSRRKLSANLGPTDEQAYDVRFPNGVRTLFPAKHHLPLMDDQLLFDLISGVAHDGAHADLAVNYEVRWSNDLRRVTITGGAHKFCHTVTLALVGRQFQRSPSPKLAR